MADLFPNQPIDIEMQINCVKREIAMRGKVYPRWVDRGKMKPEQATHEMAAMGEVLKTLEAVRDGQKTNP